MPLTTPNFSAAQSVSDTSVVILTDISEGSDNALTERRVYMQLANGNYLTEDGISTTAAYMVWPIADTQVYLSVLPRSEAPTITVQWMTDASITYSKVRKFYFDFADYVFMLGLTMYQVANNNITQNRDWYDYKMQMIVNISDAENAILYDDNTTLAQNALDRNQFLMNNQNLFF